MKSIDDIYKGSFGFIKYWKSLCNEDGSGDYRRHFEHLVFYWQVVNVTLKETNELSIVLKDNFWPSTWVETTKEDKVDDDGKVCEEFDEDNAFVGNLWNRPLSSFWMACDLYEGYFVVDQLVDGDSKPIWIAIALSNLFTNLDQPNRILIQYFPPMSQERNVQEFYHGWDSIKGLRWKVNEF